jgi:hypothetical protein
VTCRRWEAVSKDTNRDVIAIVVVLAAALAPLGCSSEGSYGARRSVCAVAIVAARITSHGTITGPTGTRITRATGPTGSGVRRCIARHDLAGTTVGAGPNHAPSLITALFAQA